MGSDAAPGAIIEQPTNAAASKTNWGADVCYGIDLIPAPQALECGGKPPLSRPPRVEGQHKAASFRRTPRRLRRIAPERVRGCSEMSLSDG